MNMHIMYLIHTASKLRTEILDNLQRQGLPTEESINCDGEQNTMHYWFSRKLK